MREQGLYSYSNKECLDVIYNYFNSMFDVSSITSVISLLCLCVANYFTGNVYLIELYIFFSFIDLIAGGAYAYKSKVFEIKKCFNWVYKILTGLTTVYFLSMVMGAIPIITPLSISTVIAESIVNLVIWILVIAELTSILTNCILLGLPVPSVIVKVVNALSHKANTKLEKILES